MATKTILHRLFSSRARAQLVTALFSEPEQEYYMRELARNDRSGDRQRAA